MIDTLPHILPAKAPPREGHLSDQQRHFCDAYIKHPDEKLAKKEAGYGPTATPLNSRVIVNEIRQRQAERTQRTDIDAGYLLTRLSRELEADLADLYNIEDGSLKAVHDWPLIWRQGLVAGVETSDDGTVDKIRISDRTKRLEMIGKHVDVQAFKERVEIDTNITLNVSAVQLLEDYVKTINVTPNDVMPLPMPRVKHAAE